jgi:hypothetical protein
VLDSTFIPPGPSGTAVLIVPGSGPTDRDGNSRLGVRAAPYAKLAAALAAEGLGSLRYDKRGVGASAGLVAREDDLTVETSVADVVELLDDLAARPGVRRVALVGHSEGGLFAMLAAARREVAALVLVATPGRPLLAVLEEQLAALAPPEIVSRMMGLLRRIAAGERIADVPPEAMALARPSLQPFLSGLLPLDPARLVAAVRAPVLIVSGGRDLQVSAADRDALRAARPDAALAEFAAMNHVLVDAPADRAGNLATYGDAGAALKSGPAVAIARFLVTP